MLRKVTIVDYGVGNLRSVSRAVVECQAEPILATKAAEVEAADMMILPGVGAFNSCINALESHGLRDAVLNVIAKGRPVLGICVGMQMLLEESEEFGRHEGIGLIPGKVNAISAIGANGRRHKIPHICWSGLQPAHSEWQGTILDQIEPGEACYFVHSHAANPENDEHWLATCDYDGLTICAAVRKGNLVGVQFHPEKSGQVGLKILNNFIKCEP